MTLLEATDLHKTYGDVTAVAGLTFQVSPGQVTGILGPNGAGKTTTLRMLLGLVRPTSGSALIDGRPYQQLAEPTKIIGATLDRTGFHGSRTAWAHLRSVAIATGIPTDRCEQVLAQIGLTADARRQVRTYSTGMRQRLALATALLGDPQVLVLDEPANGLDPAGISWLRDFIRHLAAEQGRTVLLSSHLLGEVAHVADEVLIMARGQLLAHQRLDDLTRAAHEQRTVRVRTPDAPTLLRRVEDLPVEAVFSPPDVVRFPGSGPEDIAGLLRATDIEVHELMVEQPNLEDVFMQLTEQLSLTPTGAQTDREGSQP